MRAACLLRHPRQQPEAGIVADAEDWLILVVTSVVGVLAMGVAFEIGADMWDEWKAKR